LNSPGDLKDGKLAPQNKIREKQATDPSKKRGSETKKQQKRGRNHQASKGHIRMKKNSTIHSIGENLKRLVMIKNL